MKRSIIITGAGIALAGLLGCGGGTGGSGRDIAAPSSTGAAQAAEPTKARYDEPVVDMFALKITELSRQCFGSAGCNVSFTVELSRTREFTLDPAKTYKLVYSIEGAEDAYSNNLTITGDQYEHPGEEFVEVKTKKTALKATPTAVVES